MAIPVRLANAATPTGGVPFRQLPLSPLNSNCGSGNCNSRQICIYQAMGFKPEMFTVLFAIPRTAGWLAQWQEMLADPEQKIARPRQIHTGHDVREFLPMEKRAPVAATKH